jgi:inhibitor of KinA sporulation pathway (predicted exonuclease)
MMKYIVVDLEATCWSQESDPELAEQQSTESEIIEIGAVALDEALAPLSEFQRFVRPVRHPALTAFCTSLTTITQAEVDGAELFESVHADFDAWMGGSGGAGLGFVSWSRYDHRQLTEQCRRAGLPLPGWRAIDAKVEFTEWARGHVGRRLRLGMARALEHLGLPQDGTAHRGIDDARNLVKIFQHLRDPRNISPQGRTVLESMAERHPLPTHIGHFKPSDASARSWFPRVQRELVRLELAADLGLGRGLAVTARGLDVVATER